MPPLRAGRPLKRWRYVGVFCEELMACAARVQVGPARQSFWAVHLRGDRAGPRERTRVLWRRGAVSLAPGWLRIRDAGVLLDLALEEDLGIQARCAHGRGGHAAQTGGLAPRERRRWDASREDGLGENGLGEDGLDMDGPGRDGLGRDGLGRNRLGRDGLGPGEVWTRKQAGVRARGTLSLSGHSPREVEALAVIDDTAGYHPRQTEWWWSAGVGVGADGAPLAWNLVQGINDPRAGSERAVWVAGEPSEPAPVRFAPDLGEIVAAEGSRLRFTPEAQRRRRENLAIISSDYTAPFGTFAGTLPGGVRLASGLGVMEHHRAKW